MIKAGDIVQIKYNGNNGDWDNTGATLATVIVADREGITKVHALNGKRNVTVWVHSEDVELSIIADSPLFSELK